MSRGLNLCINIGTKIHSFNLPLDNARCGFGPYVLKITKNWRYVNEYIRHFKWMVCFAFKSS